MIPARRLGLLMFDLAILALAAWVATSRPIWVILAAPLVVVGALIKAPSGRSDALASVILLCAILLALSAEFHLGVFARNWSERSLEQEAEVQLALEEEFDSLLTAGENVSVALSTGWSDGSISASPVLSPGLRSERLHAVAVFGPAGDLLAWEGSHHGPVPQAVRRGSSRYLYEEGALFGYLYITEPIEGGGVAVAAALLRSDLPLGLDAPTDDFESAFRSRTGASIGIGSAERATGGSVWDLRWEGGTLFSVTVAAPSEAETRARLELVWHRTVALVLILGWFLCAVAARSDELVLAVGALTLPGTLLLLPLSRLTGWGQIFSPAGLLLPGPMGMTLGDLLALGSAGVLVIGLLPWGRLRSIPAIAAVPASIVLVWGVLALLAAGSSRDLLVQGETGWLVFQATAVSLVALALAPIVLLTRRGDSDSLRLSAFGASIAAALLLSLVWVSLIGRVVEPPSWVPLLWIIPLFPLATSFPPSGRWTLGLARGAGALFIAVTLVLPWAWGLRVQARMAAAEERIDRLGTRSDPFLEFLLLRAGEEAATLAINGEPPVEILYGAWTRSGLAAEGLPLWITYWSLGDVAQEELRIGVSDGRPPVPGGLLEETRGEGRMMVRRFDLADTHYVGVAPLTRGALLSVVVPPRRMLETSSPLGPLLSARAEPDPLVLIPLLPGEVPGETDGVSWIATAQGWQGETFIAYPDEVYHAHYLLETPGWLLLVARGSLILLVNLAVLGALWALGRWMAGAWALRLPPQMLPGSFRARVTVALFAFFLIPSVVFGTLAYRTLAAATIRNAESLAERAVDEAGARYFELAGALDLVASGVGSDLLLYENGELVGGSPSELVQLGLYEGWIPPSIHQVMLTGEAVITTNTSSLGGWDYVVAYRRMPGGRVIAAPTPLQAGATALRQRDVADLIAFSLVLGGCLSVLLALAVGRALARPIQTLRIASERVGAGNMSVQLPDERTDEFGAVFDAFNRMVDRLSRTRKALLRSSRRTRAIVEEVAIGVVALDPEGRVTLANPKVEELLGRPVERDRPLPSGADADDPETALVEWVEGYFRDGLREAGTELSFGDRRLRVRARRISRSGPASGAVLTLEDVTDELRTERVLAWGEMAQQVAHEVKNPLTPIKLGVQHIRRAWLDRQPDYGEVLERNVEAILDEIERLATIASSFSRYAAPSLPGEDPLESVSVPGVVRDVLDLYRAGGGSVTFRLVELGPIPQATARAAELKEVLVNLLENARAALPAGGEVRIEIEKEKDGNIELRVIDEGTGIPADVLPRIFDPHFSTRSSGTGLGLAIVRRLVESWRGRVQAESAPGEGTVIRICLVPWSRESTASAASPGAVSRGDAYDSGP